MADTARTLLVLRHAKAGGEPGVNDLRRTLTGRGRRNADEAGRWLLAQGLRPDRVVCSSAERTRETWARVSAALGGAQSPDGSHAIDSGSGKNGTGGAPAEQPTTRASG